MLDPNAPRRQDQRGNQREKLAISNPYHRLCDAKSRPRRPLLRGAVLALFFAFLAAACSDEVKVGDGAVGQQDCPQIRERSDGGCCQQGHRYEFAVDACVAVGPAECAATVLEEGHVCVPSWCWDWQSDEDGSTCAAWSEDCWPVGRRCTPQEIAAGAGCKAGWWPAPGPSVGETTCVPAGEVASAADSVVVDDDGLPTRSDKVPTPPSWCHGAAGGGVGCTEKESECPLRSIPCPPALDDDVQHCQAGQAPIGDKCEPAGVPWTCPPGFIVDAAEPVPKGELSVCKPDPADCGDGPWGPLVDDGKTIFVDDSAATGGDGSIAKPFLDLAAVVASAPAGWTIAIAGGTYTTPLNIDRALNLRGRCAAMVHVHTQVSEPSIRVVGTAGDLPVRIEGMTLSGDDFAIYTGGALDLRVRRVFVNKATSAALVAKGAFARMTVEQSLIQRTQPESQSGQHGLGAYALGVARMTLRQVRLSTNHDAGVKVVGPATWLQMEQVLIDGAPATVPAKAAGMGLHAFERARVDGTGLRISGAHVVGAVFSGEGTHGRLVGARIDHTRAGAAKTETYGVSVQLGARLDLEGGRLDDNVVRGLAVMSKGSQAVLVGALVEGMAAGPGNLGGHGIVVHDQAALQVHHSWLRNNTFGGLLAHGSGTTLLARSTEVAGNGVLGVAVGAGAKARLEMMRIADSRLEPTGGGGFGVWAAGGAHIDLLGGVVVANRQVGIRPAGAGTRLRMAGTLVAATRFGEAESMGQGVWAQSGASVELVGVRAVGNRTTGIGASGAGSSLHAVGTLVDDTGRSPAEAYGQGAMIAMGATGTFTSAWLVGNSAAGVAFYGGSGTVEGSVIRRTLASIYAPATSAVVELADGIVVHDQGTVQVRGSLLAGNKRAGLLATGGVDVKLSGSVVVGSVFGLASQAGASVQASDNAMFDNSLRNRATDNALPVAPAPPTIVKPPSQEPAAGP